MQLVASAGPSRWVTAASFAEAVSPILEASTPCTVNIHVIESLRSTGRWWSRVGNGVACWCLLQIDVECPSVSLRED